MVEYKPISENQKYCIMVTLRLNEDEKVEGKDEFWEELQRTYEDM